MYINSVTLNDFKCFTGKHEFKFAKLNLISGVNGAGKSTIALHSLLFAIYGYSEVTIASLTPRLLANPDTYVEIELEYLGNQYKIKRCIPTALSFSVNGVPSTLANNQLKQKELERLFQNVDFFRKFRMIDIKDSINILEQGNQALRKTLVSFDDTMDIALVRSNLVAKKNERERLNKDTSVLYTHFPSEDRMRCLQTGLTRLSQEMSKSDTELRNNESVFYDLSNRKGRIESSKASLTGQKNNLVTSAYCPMCQQALQVTKQKELLGDVSKQIVVLNDQLATVIDDISNQREVLNHIRQAHQRLLKKRDRTAKYLHRLDSRLKQKEYVYTTKDVELLKKCVSELDRFTTFYITEKLKRLEPLINNLLNKLGFTVVFDVNDKNNFDITLINSKNGAEFKYKDLSNGQRLLVTVAFQLALLMEKNESGIIVADEGFSSLDGPNLALMFDLFKNSSFQLVSIVHRFDTNDTEIQNIRV